MPSQDTSIIEGAAPLPAQTQGFRPAEPSFVASQLEKSFSSLANAEDLETMMLYLRRSRDRAVTIRDNSPAGSYLESVLTRTISGINRELSQLSYLLAGKEIPSTRPSGMRPAV